MGILELILTSSGGLLIISGIGWFVRNLMSSIRHAKYKKEQDGYVDGMRAISNVYNSMADLSMFESVDRVLLLEVSNGGHRPKPGSIMYANAINAKVNGHGGTAEERVIITRYNRVQIDNNYISMCVSAQSSNSPYAFKVDSHVDCMLKDIYQSEHIEFAEIHHICTDAKDEKMFILSIATRTHNEFFSETLLRSAINSEVMVIKNEFSKYRIGT